MEIFSIPSRRSSIMSAITLNATIKPYSEFDILKTWKKACSDAEVESCIPRDLRHKAITDMKKAGYNDSFFGNVAGHSDPRTTKRYTHFSVEETKSPLQALVIRAKG